MGEFVFRHPCVILDASCAINLYASRQMEAILAAIPVQVTIAEYVSSDEVLMVRSDPLDGPQIKESINLQPFVDSNKLQIISLTSVEEVSAVNFAATLDNGEAFTGAVALHRKWAMALDDRQAISFYKQEAPHLQIVGTLDLIKYWADTNLPSKDAIQKTLRNIRVRARYMPKHNHVLYQWWQLYQ